jgi:exopolysaccharide production protein ExoZ
VSIKNCHLASQTDGFAKLIRPIESIQWLRFVAATLVILYHIEVELFRLVDGHQNHFGFGASGVDLFFVISGFIMVYITQYRAEGFLSFILRRLVRIVPLYWLLTLALLALTWVSPALIHSTKLDCAHVVSSFLLLPYPHPVLEVQRPLLVPGWTLNYEMFFYMLFGSLLFLPLVQRIVAVGSVLTTFVALRFFLGNESRLLDFYGFPIVLEFIAGMAIAWVYFSCDRLPRSLIVGAAIFGFVVFAVGIRAGVSEHGSRVIWWGLGAASIVLAALFTEKSYGWPNVRVLRHLGDASYSIYLSHLFVISAVGLLIKQLSLFSLLGAMGTRVVMVISALAAGSAIYSRLEQPMHKTLLRLLPIQRGCKSTASALTVQAAGPPLPDVRTC